MTTTSTRRRSEARTYSGGAVGLTVTAGIFMIIVGIFHAFQGIVALANDQFYVKTPDYVFQFDLTTWGWVHLIAGVIVALAGVALFQGAVWARAVAVVVASISILANFFWMPYYPIWSLTVIAFDAFVIWAVTVHGRDIAEQR
jgi:hypothetical protein